MRNVVNVLDSENHTQLVIEPDGSININTNTPSSDAFSRKRVSEPFTLFDSKQLKDKQPLFWDETIGGSATSEHSVINACTKMTVTASASDYVIRQTKQRFNYQPGKSQMILFTFTAPKKAGITNRMGYFNGTGTNNLTPNNGIFFECNNTLSWNICKNGTITETVSQDNWNLDKLNGVGISKKTLNMDNAQIAIIDFEWLGVGRVRVGFIIDGIIRYCHEFNHANIVSTVYMSTPNLPIRYSIQTDGTNTSYLDHICSTVMSEGGLEKTGVLRAIDTGTAFITGINTGATYAMLGIRLNASYLDITIIPESISIISSGNTDNFRYTLRLNPTIAGTFNYTQLTSSSVDFAVGTSANTVTGGLILSSGYASAASRQIESILNTALRIGSTIAGVTDTLVLCVTPINQNTTICAALNFRELL